MLRSVAPPMGSLPFRQPLGLLLTTVGFDICATSDGGAALVLAGMEFARRHGTGDPVRIRAVSTQNGNGRARE